MSNVNTQNEQEHADEESFEAMCKENLTNIIHSIKPLYRLQILFGILPFRAYNGPLVPSNWKMKTLSVLIILAFILLFLCFRIPKISAITSLYSATEQAPGIIMLSQYVSCTIISSFLLSSTQITILRTVAELDTMLHVEKYNDFYKKCHAETVNYLIILSIIHAFNSIGDMVTAAELTIATVIAHPLYYFGKLQVLAFCKSVFMLRRRLIVVNDYLETFIQDKNQSSSVIFTIRQTTTATKGGYNFIGRASEENMKIRDLAFMYDRIGKIGLMINEVWNYQIFTTLITTFIFILIMMWTSLYFYRIPCNCSVQIINTFVWSVADIYVIAIMSFACERLLLIRNETKVLVNKIIMNYDLPKIMRVQAKAFMELIEAWPLRIYVYDMFSVDITLILKFISAATTYLILIIQIFHYF